jgi:hypothetical protein
VPDLVLLQRTHYIGEQGIFQSKWDEVREWNFVKAQIFLQKREQITGTEMPEAAMRLEERSDTKLKRSSGVEDQRRIVEP